MWNNLKLIKNNANFVAHKPFLFVNNSEICNSTFACFQ